MSAFEVVTTQGHGYLANNAASALKSNSSLLEIPQTVLVVTNDFITDLGYENSSDTLRFFGLATTGFQGGSAGVRGRGTTYPYINGTPNNSAYIDDDFIDSYEIVKGPVQQLYMNAPAAGIILKTTKKPLPYARRVITGRIDSNGQYRVNADFTGPIGKLGAMALSYRLVYTDQKGDTSFENVVSNRRGVFPALQIDYHNTTVRAWYFADLVHGISNGRNPMTPSGEVFTGAGRHFMNIPPNNMIDWSHDMASIDALQKISTNWEAKITGMFFYEHRFGGMVYPNFGMDWGRQIEWFAQRDDNEIYTFWSVIEDTNGHYQIGPSNWEMKNVDCIGFGFVSTTDKGLYWTSAPFGDAAFGRALLPGQPPLSLAVPMNNKAAINAIHVNKQGEYPPPANFGTMAEGYISSIYWQHSMDVVPNWLTLMAGWTWANVSTTNINNVSTLPWNGTTVTGSQWLRHLAAVGHVTRDISIYAQRSEAFTPPGPGSLLGNGQIPPNVFAQCNELGMKTAFLGGRLSSDFAWYRLVSSGITVSGVGFFPNGVPFVSAVGSTVQEGVDGDVSVSLVPGWQVIGTFYAGHVVDQTNKPLQGSYDNSWSLFNRYEFSRTSSLHGFAVGGGVSRIGSLYATAAPLMMNASLSRKDGLIRTKPGNLANAFLSYSPNKHWLFRVNCDNLLDDTFILAFQSPMSTDPVPPRSWSFVASYQF